MNSPLDTIISYSWTTLSCRRDCSSLISRIAVTGKPSRSVSMRMRFNATNFPEAVFLALYTLPKVPSPT